ncbi:MAG: hypothetical protein OEY52_17085 [Gammaproteobacteria bacterium]|nr:hypothetical protein [Gammaproteobacteria bacterium]
MVEAPIYHKMTVFIVLHGRWEDERYVVDVAGVYKSEHSAKFTKAKLQAVLGDDYVYIRPANINCCNEAYSKYSSVLRAQDQPQE